MSASFVGTTPGCYASISLRVINSDIIEPFEISHLNENHKVKCLPKHNSYFDIKNFLKNVQTKLEENIARPTQQIYEEAKAAHHAVSDTNLPDYAECLSESQFYHADGTFHTKTRYIGQLYVIHAYFPAKRFLNDDSV
ncbi:unnamed protein product [Brachionus calyciflorus]|uniref:Uncharacterized protein n=1 Tax=Brachionus calyciflorus TaxID=104777 RepID=A0A814M2F3_9BILA|nr:unnamed protein product [Brachionus calyciflorus]